MYAYLLNLCFAYLPLLVVAILVWWGMLRWLDHLGGVNFKRDVLPTILQRDPGRYYGHRLIAVALIVYGIFQAVRF